MKSLYLPLLTLALLTAFGSRPAGAHCQVPCGIYGDEIRFQLLKEHAATIEKSMAQIGELAAKSDALSAQQLARWVATKESHATEIQSIAQQYFLAQRVKIPEGNAGADAYLDKLRLLHHIIVHAMKCKQTVDTEAASNLTAAIEAFEKAYAG